MRPMVQACFGQRADDLVSSPSPHRCKPQPFANQVILVLRQVVCYHREQCTPATELGVCAAAGSAGADVPAAHQTVKDLEQLWRYCPAPPAFATHHLPAVE